METITFGLFHTQENAENAINELSRCGFSSQDISIVMKDQAKAKEVHNTTGARVVQGIAASVVTAGAILGGVSDLLAGLGAIIVPGIDGAILLGIPTTETTDNTVKQILQKHRASQIQSVARDSDRKT